MPLFGAHLSIAGGLHRALEAAEAYGMDAVQLFTASPQTWPVRPPPAGPTTSSNPWRAKELPEDEVRTFHRIRGASRLQLAMAHDSYLINLASPDELLYRRSLEAFVVELQRAQRLGLDYLVTHPGSHLDSGEATGLKRVAGALDEVHQRCRNFHVQVLLETTAGQGSNLGHRFEQLAQILALVAEPRRLGICFDTCHVFAAGYALAPRKEYRATLNEFDRILGLDNLRAFHVNDSLKPQGSRVDRHAHIGRGCLGLEPFRLLVNDRRFRDRPMILETPKEEASDGDMDAVNLRVLRELIQNVKR